MFETDGQVELGTEVRSTIGAKGVQRKSQEGEVLDTEDVLRSFVRVRCRLAAGSRLSNRQFRRDENMEKGKKGNKRVSERRETQNAGNAGKARAISSGQAAAAVVQLRVSCFWAGSPLFAVLDFLFVVPPFSRLFLSFRLLSRFFSSVRNISSLS